MYNEEDYRKILNSLAFNKDRRKPPDNRRKARFILGWKNATLRESLSRAIALSSG
jgi:hypothetical protein